MLAILRGSEGGVFIGSDASRRLRPRRMVAINDRIESRLT